MGTRPETDRQVSQTELPKFDKRKTIIASIVTIVTLIIVFAGILPKLGNYDDAWALIQDMSPLYLAALGFATAVNILVYPFPMMPSVPGLSYGPSFVVRQTSFTISNAVPAGGALGLGVQYAMLGSYGVPPAASTAGIAVISVWSVFLTLGMPILGVIALAVSSEGTSQYLTAALLGATAIIGALVVFALILRSEEMARKVGALGQRVSDPILHRFRHGSTFDVTTAVLAFRSRIVGVVTKHWIAITASNLGMVAAQVAILFVAIRAVQSEQSADIASTLTAAEVFAAFAISRLGTMIPVTPGGLGTVDAALISLLVTFGADSNDALAATLVWRACSWIPQVLTGILTFIWWRGRQMREARAQQ